MDFIWILFAFVCGLGSKSVNLPPSIGYLIAGFVLHFLGHQADDSLEILANLGITLMLFTIGLKLNVKDLIKTEVWFGSLTHTFIWLLVTLAFIKICAVASIVFFSNLDFTTSALIAFALSFSSTVCVVKLLEDHGEMRTRHGKLSIGILVIQDIIAVAFLVVATGKIPSFWALGLLVFYPLKPVINRIVHQAGHGELIPLMGFFLALGSYELFELVGIKGDLGALLTGMFLASHSKASEINKSLMSFKDLFLIGFFLSIGFTALPNWQMLGLAGLLTLLIPIKFVLFFSIFSALKLRCRTAYLCSLTLSNYSEFGLIVAAISVKAGWLTNEWLVILALAVSLSFILTNVVYRYAHQIFSSRKDFFKQFERKKLLREDNFNQPLDSSIMVIGMGRVGMGAYHALDSHLEKKVWGVDADRDKTTWLKSQGIKAYYGDAEDAYFWEKIDLSKLELVLIALPSVKDSMNIATQLKIAKYAGKTAAIARFDDEREQLESYGIDRVFNFYNEAGVGFADESLEMITSKT